jgi:hypothetical protein
MDNLPSLWPLPVVPLAEKGEDVKTDAEGEGGGEGGEAAVQKKPVGVRRRGCA